MPSAVKKVCFSCDHYNKSEKQKKAVSSPSQILLRHEDDWIKSRHIEEKNLTVNQRPLSINRIYVLRQRYDASHRRACISKPCVSVLSPGVIVALDPRIQQEMERTEEDDGCRRRNNFKNVVKEFRAEQFLPIGVA